MANLIKLSNDLEYVPKEQLIEMSQNPNNNYPSYLVLAEIQRRTQMEKMYAAQQPQPETTVAEELVQEYASSPQGLGAMAQTPGANPSTLGAEGNMAPPSPMQMMASGGRTGYQVGGQLTTEELKNQFLQSQGIGGFTPTAQNPTLSGTELVSDTFTSTAENEPGFFSKAINWAKENPADALSMAANATFFIPGVGVVAGTAIKGGIKLLPKVVAAAKKVAPVVKKGLQKTYTKPNPAFVQGPKGKGSFTMGGPERILSAKRTAIAALPLTGTAMNLTDLALNSDEEIIEEQTNINRPEQVDDTIISARKTVSDDVETGRRGLANFLPNADPSMLIGLGGAIMGANTIGELGSGISEVALGERAREDAQKLAGLQGRMMEAQIAKYEADVANMSVQQIINEMNAINKGVESGAMQIDDELRAYMITLSKELEKQRNTGTGYAASEAPTGGEMDIFEETKIPA